MRSISLTLAALSVFALGASAQTTKEPNVTTTTAPAAAGATKNAETAASGVEVGVSRRDGVTYSDGAAYITRNGLMERLVRELELPGGVKVAPDGNVTMPGGQMFRLKSDQLVTPAGVVQTITPVPAVASPLPAPAPASVGNAPATGGNVRTRDTSQATVTGNTVNVPERVGAGSQAK